MDNINPITGCRKVQHLLSEGHHIIAKILSLIPIQKIIGMRLSYCGSSLSDTAVSDV